MQTAYLLMISWAGSLIAAVLLAIPLRPLASHLWHLVVPTRQVPGRWDTRYWYEDEKGAKRERNDVVELRQRGTYVTGRNERGSDRQYVIQARIVDNRILTGTWRSVLPECTYQGVVHLVIAADGQSMVGKWLSVGNRPEVDHGEWTWEKIVR